MGERQFDKTVKTFRRDNGPEFMCLTSYFQEQEIMHQMLCVDTPQQNGRVEWKHRHILNVARACLFQTRLPMKFWGENILIATHSINRINRTPSSVLQGKSPYEVLFRKWSAYSMLRSLDVSIMLIIVLVVKIKSRLAAGVVSSLVTHMVRKDGTFVILEKIKFSFVEMLFSKKMFSPLRIQPRFRLLYQVYTLTFFMMIGYSLV